jgi:hypothetical protein
MLGFGRYPRAVRVLPDSAPEAAPAPLPRPPAPREPAAVPWTHHELIPLVEPFARRGRRVDMAASNRLERRLVFRAVAHAAEPQLSDTLQLDTPAGGVFRLTRMLARPDGLQARLVAEGPSPAALLEAFDAVPAQRQFGAGPGFELALGHRLLPNVAAGYRRPAPPELMLTTAEVVLDGYRLTLQMTAVKGIAADVELRADDGETLDLPQDLLSVLGGHWSRLTRRRDGWAASLRLRGSGAERSADAESKLTSAARHLAETLAEEPGRFHPRWRGARWRAAARRGFPLAAIVLMCIAAAAVPQLDLQDDSVLRMLVFQAPPLLLVLFFGLGEMPRIEVPPWPRQLTATAWRKGVAPGPAGGSSS